MLLVCTAAVSGNDFKARSTASLPKTPVVTQEVKVEKAIVKAFDYSLIEGAGQLARLGFLDKLDPKTCECLTIKDKDLDGFWSDEGLKTYLSEVRPSEYEARLKTQIEALIAWQISKAQLYFESQKTRIVDSLKAEHSKLVIELRTWLINQLIVLYSEIFLKDSCEANFSKLEDLVRRIELAEGISDLQIRLQNPNYPPEFYSKFFASSNKCKEIISLRVFKGAKSLIGRDDLTPAVAKLVAEARNERIPGVPGQVVFIDSAAHGAESPLTADHFVFDRQLTSLGELKAVLGSYRQEFHSLFRLIYDLTVEFRVASRGTPATPAAFDTWLETRDFSKSEKEYIMVKFAVYFSLQAAGIEVTKKFHKEIPYNRAELKRFINIFGAKEFVKTMITTYKLPIVINEFEAAVEQDSRKSYIKNSEAYFSARLTAGAKTGPEEESEFGEYLVELKASKDPANVDFAAKVARGVMRFVAIKTEVFDSKTWVFCDGLVAQLVRYYSVKESEIVGWALAESTNGQGFFEAFEAMLRYLSHEESAKVASLALISVDKDPAFAAFRLEVLRDFSVFGGKNLLNSSAKPNGFLSDFSVNLMKLRSMIRIFIFVNIESPVNLGAFHPVYRYFALHRSKYANQLFPDFAVSLDSELTRLKTDSKALSHPFYSDFSTYIDLVRMLNLANLPLGPGPKGPLYGARFDEINFSQLGRFIVFIESSRSEKTILFLESFFAHSRSLPDYYHLNNLYLIARVALIAPGPEASKSVTALLAQVNMFEPPVSVKTRKVKTSKHAALMFLIEFKLRQQGGETFKQYLPILKQELRALPKEDLAVFFGIYFYRQLDLSRLETFADAQKEEKKDESPRLEFLRSFVKEFNSSSVAETELFAFHAYDLLRFLIERGQFTELWASNLMPSMIEHVMGLIPRNQPEAFTAQFDQLIQNHQYDTLKSVRSFLAVGYYVLAKAVVHMNRASPGVKDPVLFTQTARDFLKFFAAKYFEAKSTSVESTLFDFRFDLGHLYAPLSLLFTLRLSPEKMVLADVTFDVETSLNLAAYWIFFSESDRLAAQSSKDKVVNSIFARMQKLDKAKDRILYLNYVNSSFRRIFVPGCAAEEFTILLREGALKTRKASLDKARSTCLVSSDKEVLKTEAYQLTRAILESAEALSDQADLAPLAELFEGVRKVTREKMNFSEALSIFRKSTTREASVLTNPQFQAFIGAAFRGQKNGAVAAAYDRLAAAGLADAKSKDAVLLLAAKDLLLFGPTDVVMENFSPFVKKDLFTVLKQKPRFVLFLANLFVGFDPKNPAVLPSYLDFYLMINQFRVSALSEAGFLSSGDSAAVSKAKNSFTTLLQTSAALPSLTPVDRSRVYFLLLVHLINNQDILNFDKEDAGRCPILSDIELLSVISTEKLDKSLLTSLLSANLYARKNVNFFLSKMQLFLEEYKQTKHVYFNCPNVKNESETIKTLINWTDFMKPLSDFKANEPAEFNSSIQITVLDFQERFQLIV